MKADQIKVGRTYAVAIKGGRAEVKVTGKGHPGGWDGVNLLTGRNVHIRTAKMVLLDIDAAQEAKDAVDRALVQARWARERSGENPSTKTGRRES
jgi:hypothetical protein